MRKIVKRRIEGNLCDVDELSLGFHMFYGADEHGEFHCVSFGLLIFEFSILNYFEDDGN
jgi:hypothetical protein